MGGAHVFPGGRLDEADHVGDHAALCDGLEVAARRLAPLDEGVARQYYVAAIRESFEESGLLLARNRNRQPPSTYRRGWAGWAGS